MPTLVLIKTICLGDIEGKQTIDCMTGARWAHKDSELNGLLPVQQAAQTDSSVGVYQLQNPKGTSFPEMADAAAVQVIPVTPLETLAKKLKERGLTLALNTVEAMVEKQENGQDVGLHTDKYGNFAFIENADESVSVLHFSRRNGRWYAIVFPFGQAFRLGQEFRWLAEYRLLLSKSHAPAL